MPVNGGCIILQLIMDCDNGDITPIEFNKGARSLSIDSEIEVVDAIEVGRRIRDGKIESLRLA